MLLLAAFTISSCASRSDGPDAHAGGPDATPVAVQPPSGHVLKVRYHAMGVQIYTWNAAGATWGASTPSAILLTGDLVAGIHTAGPSWQCGDGSRIVGAKTAAATVDATAIPWLLLTVSTATGSGLLSDVDVIQRRDTKGGLAPAHPGTHDGEQALVPYSADYVFYRRE